MSMKNAVQCFCATPQWERLAVYTKPPLTETPCALLDTYYREIWRCELCGHYVNVHYADLSSLYSGAYVDATYGMQMREAFERIIRLAPDKSDNERRVARVLSLADEYLQPSCGRRVLDIGSGLCVFLHRFIQKNNWQGNNCQCVALDPDPRAVYHASAVVGVQSLCADCERDDLLKVFNDNEIEGTFGVITLNKVLEHVKVPEKMLRNAVSALDPMGFIYIELPDGESACADEQGYDREEFHLEHWHIFSFASVAMLAVKAGLKIWKAGRLREPSGKYTLWAALKNV